ncbi:MAG: isoprenylcysteine carboxylmethyltransferase family protein [Planctomycetes bacterium]|nr:isoprenylcysteine carboxylmethyltransferase family protein [Planctomycetota bacterium]
MAIVHDPVSRPGNSAMQGSPSAGPHPAQERLTGLQWIAWHRLSVTRFIGVLLVVRIVFLRNPLADPWNPANPISLAGIVLILGGIAIRSWAASLLHKENVLSVTGPYRICRHPLYLGTLFLLIGFGCALHDGVSIAVVFGLFWVLYLPTMFREERRLRERHGDAWESYRRRTPMFFPTRLPTSLGAVSWRQWRHNREYQAALGAACGLIGVKIWCVFVHLP